MKRTTKRSKQGKLILLCIVLLVVLVNYFVGPGAEQPPHAVSLQEIPAFSGEPYVVIADNEPEFFAEDLTEESYEYYSPLDGLGRCGYAMACVGQDLMPT